MHAGPWVLLQPLPTKCLSAAWRTIAGQESRTGYIAYLFDSFDSCPPLIDAFTSGLVHCLSFLRGNRGRFTIIRKIDAIYQYDSWHRCATLLPNYSPGFVSLNYHFPNHLPNHLLAHLHSQCSPRCHSTCYSPQLAEMSATFQVVR